MLRAATVSIVHEDAFLAGRDAGRELLEELGEAPSLVVVFASSRYDQAQMLAGLGAALPATTRIAGCSSTAEIDNKEALVGSVTAMGLCLSGAVGCETFRLLAPIDDPYASGRAFGETIKAKNPALLLLFPDGLAMNNAPFLLGLQESLGPQFPIFGGVPGEAALGFVNTYEYEGREAFSGGVSAIALTGPVEVVTAAAAGFQPVGVARTATRVEGGRTIYELDGIPALTLYRQYLGTRANDMPIVGLEFPLGIVGGTIGTQRLPMGEAVSVIRGVNSFDEATLALRCLGEIPQGAQITMTRATKDDLLRAAADAAASALAKMPKPEAVFFFSCAGRKLVLGSRFKEEAEKALSAFSPDVPKIGFYTYGELSPVEGTTMYHDETFTVALLREKP